jgi:predicted ATPase
LAEEKASPFWRALGMLHRGYLTALTGTTAEAVNTITTALTVFRPTRSRMWEPLYSAHLSYAHAKLGQFEEASRSIDEAMGTIETTKEKWYEAEMCRIAGEIALLSPQLGVASAETHFERALAIARQQQAKSWELRAAMNRRQRHQQRETEAHDAIGIDIRQTDWCLRGVSSKTAPAF